MEKCGTLWADYVGPVFKIFFIGKLHMHLIGFDEIALHIALTMGEEVPLELELVGLYLQFLSFFSILGNGTCIQVQSSFPFWHVLIRLTKCI